jgi:hypothetical protein
MWQLKGGMGSVCRASPCIVGSGFSGGAGQQVKGIHIDSPHNTVEMCLILRVGDGGHGYCVSRAKQIRRMVKMCNTKRALLGERAEMRQAWLPVLEG